MAAAALIGACATTTHYFAPSAATGTVGYPHMTGSAYGIFPKNTIDFSPAGYDAIRVAISTWQGPNGAPGVIRIDVGKSYLLDTRYKALPYDQAKPLIAADRVEVLLDAGAVEVNWSDGEKQIASLTFQDQHDLKFVISGEPVGAAKVAVGQGAQIKLKRNGSFDLKVPAMTFDGHRLEFPVIHFQSVD